MLLITKRTTRRETSTFDFSREWVKLHYEEGKQEERNRILAKMVSSWNRYLKQKDGRGEDTGEMINTFADHTFSLSSFNRTAKVDGELQDFVYNSR